jgi:hypothetical protein
VFNIVRNQSGAYHHRQLNASNQPKRQYSRQFAVESKAAIDRLVQVPLRESRLQWLIDERLHIGEAGIDTN